MSIGFLAQRHSITRKNSTIKFEIHSKPLHISEKNDPLQFLIFHRLKTTMTAFWNATLKEM